MKVSPTAAAVDVARIISQQCLASRARRLERTVTRLYDAALRLHGVSAAQLGMLAAIALAGEVQPKTLCTILDLEKSTLSRNIALMAEKGWIESKREGRAQLLRLTAAGSAVLTSALPAWRRAQRHAQRLLSRDAVATLRLVRGPDLPFPTRQILFHDRTEGSDGDRARQREGRPAGNPDVPASREVADAIRHLSGSKRRGADE